MFDKDEFDKDFGRTWTMIKVVWLFGAIITLALIGGMAFAAYKILNHLGIM